MDDKYLAKFSKETQIANVIGMNKHTEKYGLYITMEDAKLIVSGRNETLREQRRIEFGASIIPKLIAEFCDSSFITQNNYVETLIKLQEIFYLYKNEMEDEISDDELIKIMKDMFENLCFGDLDYLETTCLYNFAEAIRAGYRGYQFDDGEGEYDAFDTAQRWSYETYYQVLSELVWG